MFGRDLWLVNTNEALQARKLKLTMDDDGSQVEQYTGDLIGMRFKFFPSHDTVKDQSGIGKRMRLYCLRPHGSAIRRLRSTKLRI